MTFSKLEQKILTLSALGGMLELYDFIIYGIFSVYFGNQFFPSQNELIVIIESYLVFVLGYLARPLGGVIFSHMGDEYGRKKVLILTIMLMGASSIGVGLLPTYDQIGMLAPICLVGLRLIQGLALGGELPITYVYIKETMIHKQGIAFGITMSGVNAGILLGASLNYGLNKVLSFNQLTEFGWRLPFIFGGVLCIVSYYIRKSLHETPTFQKIHRKPRFPLGYLISHQFKTFLWSVFIVAPMASFIVTMIYMPMYLKTILQVNAQTIPFSMAVMMVFNILVVYVMGTLIKHHSPTYFLKCIIALCCVVIPLTYFLLYANQITLGLVLLGMVQGATAMLTPYIISNVFESKIRLTGVALSYNISFSLFGGLAPVIITHFIQMGWDKYLTPPLYLFAMIGLCWLGLTLLEETNNEAAVVRAEK